MFDSPIESIMAQTMRDLKNLIDVNTVVGKPICTGDVNCSVIPISKVSVGFLVGGGEYQKCSKNQNYPYTGGTGAGISVNPIGFLVCNGVGHKLVKLSDDDNKMSDVLSAVVNLFSKND